MIVTKTWSGAGLIRTALIAILFLSWAPVAQATAPLTIVISIDGFRADYLKRGQTPVLAALAKTGVSAAMRPSFPSLTFPNHYTLVTGLRPDHHGVVDNLMFDLRIGADKFTMTAKTSEDPRWWEGAKPLWVSAEEAGRITAASGFVGTDKSIFGYRPHYLDPWRDKRPAEDVAPVALNWLDLPINLRPSMEFLYFYEIDHEGHEHGPDSPELNAALRKVDAAVGTLVKGLKKRRLYDKTDIVIVADHGMTSTPKDQFTVIDWLVPSGEGVVRTWGSGAGIDALPGHETVVAAILLQPHEHFHCWRKSEIPPALHYGSNARVPQFYCLNDPGWRFAVADDIAQKKKEMPGSHGYDPALPDMQALFLAHGPAFRRGTTLPVFDNVDVYPMLARITGLTPEPNDGNPATLIPALSP